MSDFVYIVCVKERGAKTRNPISAYDTRKQAETSVSIYRMMDDAKDWVYTDMRLWRGWVDRGPKS